MTGVVDAMKDAFGFIEVIAQPKRWHAGRSDGAAPSLWCRAGRR